MGAGYRRIEAPARIPVPGGKLIEEWFGRVNGGSAQFSLAHMIAPPGWGEPAQRPQFGELTLLVRGALRVELDAERVELRAGQAIWIEAGQRVRYSNPYTEENEYYAVCLPAFSPGLARREE